MNPQYLKGKFGLCMAHMKKFISSRCALLDTNKKSLFGFPVCDDISLTVYTIPYLKFGCSTIFFYINYG